MICAKLSAVVLILDNLSKSIMEFVVKSIDVFNAPGLYYVVCIRISWGRLDIQAWRIAMEFIVEAIDAVVNTSCNKVNWCPVDL